MAQWGFGLRAKSLLALTLACLFALIPATLISFKVLENVRDHFGEAYARNLTELNRQRILGPIARDIALAERFANSEITRQWLNHENDAQYKEIFFKEAEGYRASFSSHGYFLASATSHAFYFNDPQSALSETPRYWVNENKASDSWFFSTIKQTEPFNINVNDDVHLGITQVWLNFKIMSGDKVLGVAGTGSDLSGFLNEFVNNAAPGVTPMILSRKGAIQAHKNKALIAKNQAADTPDISQTLSGLLKDAAAQQRLTNALSEAEKDPTSVQMIKAPLEGRTQLIAIAYIPELKWHIVSAIDLDTVRLLDGHWFEAMLLALVLLIATLLVGSMYAVDRLILRPIKKLEHSASLIARGNFDVEIPTAGRDELGDLTTAFGIMAQQVQINTEKLDGLVRERTLALESANQSMRQAHKKINDSIDYASLIQKAILPTQQLAQQLGNNHFVLWRPRDVVGGDFYVCRAESQKLILGVVDCAGHGVPGALMTMLARAALDQAMTQVGLESPAKVLTTMDQIIRTMLNACELPKAIATNMDIGLACIDLDQKTLRYAGAKISLYWSNGDEIGEVHGGRRAIGDRKSTTFEDSELSMRAGTTYYLATDGYLDQAGGELGYGFGNSRFAQLLLAHAKRPMTEQAAALDEALNHYRGELPQRDDITILSFRFD